MTHEAPYPAAASPPPKTRISQARTSTAAYQPPWKGVFERWTRKWVSHNYWRVRHIIDSPEDAVQECAVVFAKCCIRYGDRVTNPASFMALYMRAIIKTWNTMALLDAREREMVLHTNVYDVSEYEVDSLGSSMATKLLELSKEARLVLQTLINAPAEVIDYIAAGRHRRRDRINRRVLYLLGFRISQLNAIDEVTELVEK